MPRERRAWLRRHPFLRRGFLQLWHSPQRMGRGLALPGPGPRWLLPWGPLGGCWGYGAPCPRVAGLVCRVEAYTLPPSSVRLCTGLPWGLCNENIILGTQANPAWLQPAFWQKALED